MNITGECKYLILTKIEDDASWELSGEYKTLDECIIGIKRNFRANEHYKILEVGKVIEPKIEHTVEVNI